MRWSVLIALLASLASPAQAQNWLFSMDSVEDGQAWEAVGRLEISGEAFCTGALIAPDIVLTAAHCLYDAETNSMVSTRDIQFLAGWRNGRAAAYRRVRHAVHHPGYDPLDPSGGDKVRNDIALLKLQHPIKNTTVVPFETDLRPGEGAEIGVVSYAHDRSEAPSLQELCDILAEQDGILIMSCSVDFGSSGSPVFSFESGEPKIVSVVSGKAKVSGVEVSLGTALQEPLDGLLAQINGPQPLPQAISRTSASPPNAKFIRP